MDTWEMAEENMNVVPPEGEIAQWYNGQNIFLTGRHYYFLLFSYYESVVTTVNFYFHLTVNVAIHST